MDYEKEVLKKAESDEPIYLSPEAKELIQKLRSMHTEDRQQLTERLLNQMCDLFSYQVCEVIPEKESRALMQTVKEYRDLITSVIKEN